MPNYANGAVYKIWSLSTPEIYIGSTVETLSRRMTKHRCDYKKYKAGKKNYITSFKILEYGDARIELIEQVNCKCREELVAREGHYIRTLDCVNKLVAGRTGKEYYQDNKDRVLQRAKQYREENKDKILQYKQQYYQDNKEKLYQYQQQYRQENRDAINQTMKQYRINNKEKLCQYQQQYRQANRDKMTRYQKQYQQANKEKIKLGKQKKITCECGVSLTRGCLTRHKKTKKHLAFMNTLN